MTALRLLALAAAFALAAPLGAGAQDASSGDAGFDLGGGQPIEISADNGIEWNRDAKTYTARGNAVAVQGTSEVHADTLIATYSASSSQIDHVVAEGAVKIMSPSQTAYGDHADFDQTRRLLVMTGAALKIVSADQTVTARDAFEYWQDQDALVAKGDVVILKSDGTRIDGDQATSYFRRNATTGKREAFQVKAEGNVRIDTGKEVATCSRALYDPNTQIAVLTGNVVLTQNKNVFRGARAEIDMAKGISRLLPAPGERVRSTIQPKQKSNQGSSAPASPATSAAPAGGGALALGTATTQ
ncbi:LptA/OstA family protein [Dongia sedimenti]|uniref:LptA/OstA family protein n=1 Tax=Dongia sedimenti TaxID=3064282 RepID=A0ABU0YLW5_9PROT|nr:LptA/OstA family protein [Rhodospirillaceae bacterium R-7]